MQLDQDEDKAADPTIQNFIPKESKVGKKLTDLTTRRVIILVLAMLISQPVFQNNLYENDNTPFLTPLLLLQSMEGGSSLQFNQMFASMVQN